MSNLDTVIYINLLLKNKQLINTTKMKKLLEVFRTKIILALKYSNLKILLN